MPIKTNIQAQIERLKLIEKKAAELDVSAALIGGINVGMAAMKFRIFNNGLDANNDPLGKYVGVAYYVSSRRLKNADVSSAYKKKKVRDIQKNLNKYAGKRLTEYEKRRIEKGRQIQKKDSEFTGSLRRSIIVGKTEPQRATIIINNPEQAKIAVGQEIQIGRIRGEDRAVIFTLSREEKDLVIENTNALLKQIYDRLISS